MTIKVDVNKSDVMVRDIYDNFLKSNKKWISLDLSEKLKLISDLKGLICELMEMGDEDKLNSLTGQLIVDSINERGPSRLRKFTNLCNDVKERHMEIDFKNPEKREEMLDHYRKVMNAINLTYDSDDDKLKED